eukprot:bmy_02826T0
MTEDLTDSSTTQLSHAGQAGSKGLMCCNFWAKTTWILGTKEAGGLCTLCSSAVSVHSIGSSSEEASLRRDDRASVHRGGSCIDGQSSLFLASPRQSAFPSPHLRRPSRRFKGPSELCRTRGSGRQQGHEGKRGRQSRPPARPLAPRGVTLAACESRIGQVGGTCGRAREAAARSPRCGTPAGAGPAGRLGRASPRGSPAWGRAAGPGPGLRQLGGPPGPPPAPPLTEEALHDPQRVTEPILPTGHLADGPEPARPGVPRRCSSSLARPLLARALPRRVSLAARASPRLRERRLWRRQRGAAGDRQAARSLKSPRQPEIFSADSYFNSQPAALPLPRSSPSRGLHLYLPSSPGSGRGCHVLRPGREAYAAMLVPGSLVGESRGRLTGRPEFRPLCASAEVCWPRP